MGSCTATTPTSLSFPINKTYEIIVLDRQPREPRQQSCIPRTVCLNLKQENMYNLTNGHPRPRVTPNSAVVVRVEQLFEILLFSSSSSLLLLLLMLLLFPIGTGFNLLNMVGGGVMYLVCNVTDAENLDTTITFVRNSDQSTVCSCEQRGDHCICDTTGYIDYKCGCGTNTNVTKSEYKVYAMQKINADDQDTGDWRCGSDALGWSKPGVAVIGKYKHLHHNDQHYIVVFLFFSQAPQNVSRGPSYTPWSHADLAICQCRKPTWLYSNVVLTPGYAQMRNSRPVANVAHECRTLTSKYTNVVH